MDRRSERRSRRPAAEGRCSIPWTGPDAEPHSASTRTPASYGPARASSTTTRRCRGMRSRSPHPHRRAGMASIEVTIAVTDVDEPPGVPGAPADPGREPPMRLTLRWTAPENTGPPIERYDLEYPGPPGGPSRIPDTGGPRHDGRDPRAQPRHVATSSASGPGTRRASGRGRRTAPHARRAEGVEGGSPTPNDQSPGVSPASLPAGATATAGGRVETFPRAGGLPGTPQGGCPCTSKASSADPSIARASFDGAVVAVRPLDGRPRHHRRDRVGRRRTDAVVGVVRHRCATHPTSPDPNVSVDASRGHPDPGRSPGAFEANELPRLPGGAAAEGPQGWMEHGLHRHLTTRAPPPAA